MRRIRSWVAMARSLSAIALVTPTLGQAQAVCSAPHSSPTLAQSGSIGALPAGAGWVQFSLYRQQATDFYSPSGARQDFLADARFNTRSVFITGAVGVGRGIELWAQVPTHWLDVKSDGGNSNSNGVGDLRLAARVSPALLGLEFPVAVRFGTKVPGSEFPVDATVLPLTEGQRDWEVSVESGGSLGDKPIYVMGWLGYRWRGPNEPAARHPGDERFAHLAVGGTAGSLNWEIAGDGLWGTPPIAQGIVLEGEARRLVQIIPTIGVPLGVGRLEATGQIPVSGRNLPAGVGISLGYRMLWGM